MSQYQTVDKDGVFVVTCPPTIEMEGGANLDAQIKTWLLSTSKIHVLDLKEVANFKQTAYRVFVIYCQQLKANGKQLFTMNASPALATQFKSGGLTSVFQPIASLDEAKKKAAPGKSSIDVDFINPFIAAVVNVLETQAQVKITPGKAYLKKLDEEIPMEIAGVLQMSCKEFAGSINICFRADVFLKIYEGLTGEKHEKITPELEDAAAELLNMIFGQAKTVLNDQKGYTLSRALPAVLTGPSISMRHQSKASVIIIPFESTAGAFHLEILAEMA